jgi:signal transduction histidine kinase
MLSLAWAARAQTAQNGFADLTSHDFSTDGAVDLSGRWEFYWNELLRPDQFAGKEPSFISVPGSWHRQGDYTALGFATYRILIKLPENQNSLTIYFPIINSAAKVWINNMLVEQTGTVSADRGLSQARLVSTMVSVPQDEDQIQLVVQVSNYAYFSGGIAGSPYIDRSSAVFARLNRNNGIENLFAGSLIAMFIYQLVLYFLYHRGKPYLWLSLICLGVALRALIVHGGSFMLPNLYPAVDWEYWKKIEFGSVYAIVGLFPLYVRDLFREHAPKKPILFFVSLASLMCLTVLVTPQYTYGKLLEICHGGLLLAFIYAVYSIGRAWRAGNQDARTILLGVLASFPFILAEILKNSRFFPVEVGFMYLVELGVLVFLLFQVYLLAHHYAKSYQNLETHNIDLERMVEERTTELMTANTVKDRLLSVMSHDIKSPLNSLRGILQIYNKGAISRDEFGEFSRHIENDLNKTSILVENILFWTSSQLKGVEVHIEKFLLHDLIEENIQLFRTIASSKNILLTQQAQPGVYIKSDRNILNLAIRNLLSNAIKFSYTDSEVKVLVDFEKNDLCLHVQDEGVGMDEAVLRNLFAPELVSSSGTGNEKGTGLGLSLCSAYLQKAGGGLSVKSVSGKGTTFSIRMPLHP